MRLVLCAVVSGSSVRSASGTSSGLWPEGSVVVPCHVVPSKKVTGLGSRCGRVGDMDKVYYLKGQVTVFSGSSFTTASWPLDKVA